MAGGFERFHYHVAEAAPEEDARNQPAFLGLRAIPPADEDINACRRDGQFLRGRACIGQFGVRSNALRDHRETGLNRDNVHAAINQRSARLSGTGADVHDQGFADGRTQGLNRIHDFYGVVGPKPAVCL